MSSIGRPIGRPLGSGGKGKGRGSHAPSSSQQRNVVQHMTPPTESEIVPPTPVDNDNDSQSQQFIPFGDPTLPVPHNMHLPWGKDPSDNKGWIYPLKGYFYPDDNATKDISKAIKSMFDGPYNNWKCCNDAIKKLWFNEWAKGYKWIGEHESTIKAMWESKAKELLRKIMSRARENISQKPSWIPDNVWAELLAKWTDDNYQTLCCVASANRHSDTDGSLYTQGSKNQFKHELELAKSLGRMPHKGELFKKSHIGKGTQNFVDKRSSDAYENFVNLCSQAESHSQSSESGDNGSCSQPKPIDYDALMIEAVGGRNAKGRVYGLGLDGRMRASTLTSKSQHANYTDIVCDLDAMDLDGDDPSIGDAATPGRDPTKDMDVDDEC
ncbi:putative transposase, Ptta/En/Spm, plant [Sesbania bispinosa]|nr:putative transposase, Ptta/En/Spm, plant [Sesbania bispinosa]